MEFFIKFFYGLIELVQHVLGIVNFILEFVELFIDGSLQFRPEFILDIGDSVLVGVDLVLNTPNPLIVDAVDIRRLESLQGFLGLVYPLGINLYLLARCASGALQGTNLSVGF